FRVLDLGQVVAGNFCGALLAYFGADVIKVEQPGKGDALRSLRFSDSTGTSLWWRTYGRNRRCVTINLHHEEGRELTRQLAEKADVLLENFRPGVMEKWNLGPKDLSPGLIFTRISGYGQTGPKASLAGYASVCEGYGGLRHLNGFPDMPPVRPNFSYGDSLAGLHAAFGTVMALLHRQRKSDAADSFQTSHGQVIDASISESVFNMLEGCISEYAMLGHDRQPSGSTISGVVPTSTTRTKDGRWVIIGGNGDSVYSRLMAAVGHPEMGTDNPKYANNTKRCAAQDEIYKVIDEWVESKTLDEVLAAMKEARVPSGPILSPGDIYKEEQFQQRNMFHTAQPPGDESGEPVVMPAMLPVLSETPGSTKWAGPSLGQHTEEVLRGELGLKVKEIQRLRDVGAI
ncbi:hypothetical protein WJX84_004941, partial [Apatococcus fuscideae]